MIEVGRIINDNTKWNCDWIPFILLNSGSKVTAIQYYYKEDMMNIESSVMKEKLQEIGKLTGGISVIPIIPDELIKDKYLYNSLCKHGENGCFTDVYYNGQSLMENTSRFKSSTLFENLTQQEVLNSIKIESTIKNMKDYMKIQIRDKYVTKPKYIPDSFSKEVFRYFNYFPPAVSINNKNMLVPIYNFQNNELIDTHQNIIVSKKVFSASIDYFVKSESDATLFDKTKMTVQQHNLISNFYGIKDTNEIWEKNDSIRKEVSDTISKLYSSMSKNNQEITKKKDNQKRLETGYISY